MRIAGCLKCSLVNGYGCRYVIFSQGCKHHCKGCHNPDTWSFSGGYDVDEEHLAKEIKEYIDNHPIDGITISGGDPYYQQEEFVKLLKLLPNVDVWIYTGFEWDEIKDAELTKMASHVVVGRFIEELKFVGGIYGSSNQRIVEVKNGMPKL